VAERASIALFSRRNKLRKFFSVARALFVTIGSCSAIVEIGLTTSIGQF